MSTWKLWAGSYISGSSSRSASTYLDGVVSTWSASIDAAALLPGKCRNMQHVHHWHPEVLIGLDMENFVRICASLGHTGTFYSICIDTVACFEEVFCWNLKNIATWNKTRNIMAFVPCQIQKQSRFESHGDILRFEDGSVGALDPGAVDSIYITPLDVLGTASIRQAVVSMSEPVLRLWTLLHGCWANSCVTLHTFARPHRKWYSSLADHPDHICWFCRKWSTEMRIQDMCGASSLEGGMGERNLGSLGSKVKLQHLHKWHERIFSQNLSLGWKQSNSAIDSGDTSKITRFQSPGESPDTASSPLVAGSASLDASALLQGFLSEFESIQQKRQSLTLLLHRHRSDINRISVSLCPKTLPLKWSSCCEYNNNFEIQCEAAEARICGLHRFAFQLGQLHYRRLWLCRLRFRRGIAMFFRTEATRCSRIRKFQNPKKEIREDHKRCRFHHISVDA